MQRTAMGRDFSWHTAARHYMALYDELMPGVGFGSVAEGRDAASRYAPPGSAAVPCDTVLIVQAQGLVVAATS